MAEDKPKGRVEATKEIGVTNLSRRFVGVDLSTGAVIKGTLTQTKHDSLSGRVAVDKKPRAKKVLAKAEKAAKPLAKSKGGRPKKPATDQPWVKAGLSKSAYYRKLKA